MHDWGYCLATYQPQRLAPGTVDSMHWQLQLLDGRPGAAMLTELRADGRRATAVHLATRSTAHVRHQHKYVDRELPPDRGFHFRTDHRHTGAVATNLRQFVAELARCDATVLHHHTAGGDFSRWARDVLRDPALAKRLRHIEGHAQARADDERLRSELLQATASRYRLG